MRILVLKVGALGDVLRTTAVLPGLHRRYPGASVLWVTHRDAVELLQDHPGIERVLGCVPGEAGEAERVLGELGDGPLERVIALDDEPEVCALASRIAQRIAGPEAGGLTGAHLDGDGRPTYTPDAAPWFDLGLLSRLGRPEADRRKLANRRSHAQILAEVVGVQEGRLELHLPEDALRRARERLAHLPRPRIGLNTGAGERWPSKRLDEERTAALARELDRRVGGPGLVLLGGDGEVGRNGRIARAVGLPTLLDTSACDAGHGGEPRRGDLIEFAALVDGLDLLITSDSLALHLALARGVRLVAFFAPTSSAEVDLYGLGEKVVSTAPDAGSYRPDADTSSLTVERLVEAALRVLG